jgi:shikimate kinase
VRSERARTIALIGLRASGKTTVGRALARELGLPFVDLDDEILREAPSARAPDAHHAFASAGDVLATIGEPAFREIEARALERVLALPDAFVLGLGGGTVVRADNRAILATRAYVVWLDVPVEVLQRRLRADPSQRPALRGGDSVAEVREIAGERASAYAAAADWRLEAGSEAPADLACRIRARLEQAGLVHGAGR